MSVRRSKMGPETAQYNQAAYLLRVLRILNTALPFPVRSKAPNTSSTIHGLRGILLPIRTRLRGSKGHYYMASTGLVYATQYSSIYVLFELPIVAFFIIWSKAPEDGIIMAPYEPTEYEWRGKLPRRVGPPRVGDTVPEYRVYFVLARTKVF